MSVGYAPLRRHDRRFNSSLLPVEYTPLSDGTVFAGEGFGPLSFSISRDSHQHHTEFLDRCSGGGRYAPDSFLFPFEFWPLPRAMSQCKFGRLNEVISIRAERLLVNRPSAGQPLMGETVVQSVAKRGGLCFGFFESETRTDLGAVCMRAKDTLLLASGCDPEKLRQAVLRIKANTHRTTVDSPAAVLNCWTLQMRYRWDEDLWRNNIHTRSYATSLGYEHPLVEGPAVADIVCSLDRSYQTITTPLRVSWKYLGPLYDGQSVVLVRGASATLGLRRYYVCEAPRRYPYECPTLVELEVEEL